MQEFEVRRNGAVWKFIHPNEAYESLSVRERLARRLDHLRVAFGGPGELPRRQAHPGCACRVQNAPLEGARLIKLQLEQLLQSQGYIHGKRAAGRCKLPASFRFLEELPLQEVVNDCDHEKGIATAVAVDKIDELSRRKASRQLGGEILCDVRGAK